MELESENCFWITYSKLKKALETIEHIKKQNETLEKVIKAIDALPEEITVQDEGKVHHANALYIVLDDEYQKKLCASMFSALINSAS